MKKRSVFVIILCSFMCLFVFLAIAQEAPPGEPKRIEELIDDAIKDLGTQAQQAEPEGAAAPAAPGTEEAMSKEAVDFEFSRANLEDVVRLIAEVSNRNIVLDPELQGQKIDLHLKKVSADQALELLYSAYGLSGSDIGGNILFISTREKIKKGTLQTKVRELRNITTDDAKELVGNLVNAINLGKEVNTVVLVGAAEDIAKAEAILDKVDVPQPQVLLEAKIIEINNDALRDIGIDWSDQISITAQETNRATTLATTALGTGSGPMHIYRLARSALQFNMTLKMLEYENKAKVLSNPRVTTMNNKKAEIFIGDKIPYTVSIISGGTTTTEVRWVEPGIRLTITPTIIEKDFVVIKVEPEVSYIYAWRGTGDAYPWIKSRQAVANVRVQNNQPFVLGGLLNNEDKKNLYSIPYLGKIPLLGNLFSYEKKTVYNTDLIITVTPTIISSEN